MDIPVFDSRDLRYKSPFGAVPCGTMVTATVRPLLSEGFDHVTMVVYGEFAASRREVVLTHAGTEGDRCLFTGAYMAPEEPELIWYCFRLVRRDGQVVWLGKNGYCGEGEAHSWQQTVYDDSLPTPGLVRQGRDLPDFSRSLPPHGDPRSRRNAGGPLGPPGVERADGVPPRRARGNPQPGLLRRQSGGH